LALARGAGILDSHQREQFAWVRPTPPRVVASPSRSLAGRDELARVIRGSEPRLFTHWGWWRRGSRIVVISRPGQSASSGGSTCAIPTAADLGDSLARLWQTENPLGSGPDQGGLPGIRLAVLGVLGAQLFKLQDGMRRHRCVAAVFMAGGGAAIAGLAGRSNSKQQGLVSPRQVWGFRTWEMAPGEYRNGRKSAAGIWDSHWPWSGSRDARACRHDARNGDPGGVFSSTRQSTCSDASHRRERV